MLAAKQLLERSAVASDTKLATTEKPNNEVMAWKCWCRLCAKEDQESNLYVFADLADASSKMLDTTLATAIGKFFWVNIRPNDELSKYVCVDCHTLVVSLMQFTERVNKVQAMFCALQNSNFANALDLNQVKSQYGLLDVEWEHLMKCKTESVEETAESKKETKKAAQAECDWEEVVEMEDEEGKETEIIELETDGDSKNGAKYSIELIRRGKKRKSDASTVVDDDDDDDNLISLASLVEGSEAGEGANNADHFVFETGRGEAELDDAELLQQLMGDEGEAEAAAAATEVVATLVVANDDKNENNKELMGKLKQHKEDNNEKRESDDEIILHEEILDTDDEHIENIEDDIEGNEEDAKSEDGSQITINDEATNDGSINAQEQQQQGGEKSAQVNKIDSSSRLQQPHKTKRRRVGRPTKYYLDQSVTGTSAADGDAGAVDDDGEDEDEAAYKYECSICNKKYKNPTSYRKHQMEKHDQQPDIPDFICLTCEKVLPTERQLQTHARTHMPLEEKLDVPCPYCERKFTKTSVMRQHIRCVHENKRSYMCDVCGQPSKTLAALAEHKLVHTNYAPFECEVCKRGFKNRARLKVHMETHNASAFVCIQCGLKLNTSRTLKMHMLVHSDTKRYKCDFCPAAFKRTKALKNHLILHTGMRPYKCHFCEKTFSNGSNCRSHKKKMHARELAEEEAMGKKTEVVTVPKLEELRSSTNVVTNPRKVQRHHGGLPLHMRRLLIAAEERVKREKELEQDMDSNSQNIIDISAEEITEQTLPLQPAAMQEFVVEDGEATTKRYQIQPESGNVVIEEGDEEDDDDNEMVVYEIIAEI